MAKITFHGVGIKALSACVPSEIVYNKDLGYLIPEEEIEKTISNIGIEQRRIAAPDVTASDLCFKAARRLMEDNQIAPESIDVLLFMSQTADYRIPATSCLLQQRLGLPRETLCFDISLGCSGYLFALSTAFAYASMQGINRVLLLDGETFSKIVNRRDKVDWPLYGDAGTATLIEKGDYGDSTFMLYTDGSGENTLKIHAGMRNPITPDSCVEREQEEGNIRNDLEVFMDGMDVFNFAISKVPKSIKLLLKETDKTIDDVDYLVFHQANRFMMDFFVKKLKISPDRVPYCISKYGNTSSASVPLTVSSELSGQLDGSHTVVMSAFGAGLSWGATIMQMRDCKVSPVIEY
ncbi:MAG: ketoacyl-ACP synthase III [Muribaculaceae bacterium]|nr:ketoacyl-ACP synthase III [Muribaculaceae bacterium]